MSGTKANVEVEVEETTTPEQEGQQPPAQETSTESESPSDEQSDSEDEEEPGGNADELPEWARKSLEKANKEAARYRTQVRDLEKKFEGAKTPEEFDALRTEFTKDIAELRVEQAIEKALRVNGLDDSDVDLIRDSDPEKIAAKATALAARLGSAPPSLDRLKGGLNPNDEDEDTNNPGELAKKYGRRR